jgi:hypothetical protein
MKFSVSGQANADIPYAAFVKKWRGTWKSPQRRKKRILKLNTLDLGKTVPARRAAKDRNQYGKASATTLERICASYILKN